MPGMGSAPSLTNPEPTLLLACLCAAWCNTCEAYKSTFEALSQEHADRVGFLWVDIEDDAELLGELDIENFPCLLMARGPQALFFGTVLPHASHARDLLQRAISAQLQPCADP
jgi:thiol-disulfide isomerase/thioredoxin